MGVDGSEVLVGRIAMGVLVGGMGLGNAVRVWTAPVCTILVSGVDGKANVQADSRRKVVIKPRILLVIVTLTFG